MKNGITLLIASVLLILCVMQKEARYGSSVHNSVEKIYKSSSISGKNNRILMNSARRELLTDSRTFKFASMDTTSNAAPATRLVNQRLLNISANSKMLNY